MVAVVDGFDIVEKMICQSIDGLEKVYYMNDFLRTLDDLLFAYFGPFNHFFGSYKMYLSDP